jgi:hypothetical protein
MNDTLIFLLLTIVQYSLTAVKIGQTWPFIVCELFSNGVLNTKSRRHSGLNLTVGFGKDRHSTNKELF